VRDLGVLKALSTGARHPETRAEAARLLEVKKTPC
jgi:hypothetical protein